MGSEISAVENRIMGVDIPEIGMEKLVASVCRRYGKAALMLKERQENAVLPLYGVVWFVFRVETNQVMSLTGAPSRTRIGLT